MTEPLRFPKMPDDMEEGYQQLRLAIMRQQFSGYDDIERQDVLTVLGVLCDLVCFERTTTQGNAP